MELGPGQRRAALARLPRAWCTWVARPALRLEFAVETDGHVSGFYTGGAPGEREPPAPGWLAGVLAEAGLDIGAALIFAALPESLVSLVRQTRALTRA